MIGRREFLKDATAAATGSLIAPGFARAAERPETTRIRFGRSPSACYAPQYVAEELLRAEGFSEVEYVSTTPAERVKALGAGRIDFTIETHAVPIAIDAGAPIVVLAGVHVGCYELFATGKVQAIRDLRGKRVTTHGFGTGPYFMLAVMAAYVGIDPRKDIAFEVHPGPESIRLLAEGKVDAFMAFPPEPQELRARKIGHVIVNTATERPWSEHFCCLLAANRDFVRAHPVATKRALRAVLKAVDICATEPERGVQALVDRKLVTQPDYVRQALKEIPFGKWREYDPEHTIRFHALRLREVGLIKATPQKIIAQGTDWRFLNELKRELKG